MSFGNLFKRNHRKEPNILVFTGAGLSAPSGIKTFRDYNGLWDEYDPMVVANMLRFKENKELVFRFYNQRRAMLAHVKPNEGHYMIAELQKEYGSERVKICTQNVDDLLERAGCTDVLHVHGKLTEMMCLAHRHTWDIGYGTSDIGDKCPECGNTGIKPGVVFFHEHAPFYREMDQMFHEKRRHFNDVVLCVGTGFEVIPESRILGFKTSFNILANLHEDAGIAYEKFNEVIFGDIADTSVKISRIIRKQMSA